jgi:Inner membrane component of T3SS, cytoplasmic domain/zinc-ribbon domain
VGDVYCNNCGHRNPLGAKFCSSCGSVLETSFDEPTTVTFHPALPIDPVDEDINVDLGEIPTGTGALVVLRGPKAGSRFLLTADVTTAGRHPNSDIFLDDITVSRRHAEIRRHGLTYVAADAGSLNGTYVNRQRIDGETAIGAGDELQIGKFKLVFFVGSA